MTTGRDELRDRPCIGLLDIIDGSFRADRRWRCSIPWLQLGLNPQFSAVSKTEGKNG